MERILNEEEVRAAELAVSKCFETAGTKRLLVKTVLEYAKATGLHKAEIKEARKRLGVTSKKEDRDYWWTWPEGIDPQDINAEKSVELIDYD